MKFTKKQIEKIIREEYKAVKENLVPKEQVAKAAQQLGYMLVGQPPAAAAVRDALAPVYPDAAKALYSAYQKSQTEADMMYSGDYDDDDDYGVSDI
jgi:hypothetical protein